MEEINQSYRNRAEKRTSIYGNKKVRELKQFEFEFNIIGEIFDQQVHYLATCKDVP